MSHFYEVRSTRGVTFASPIKETAIPPGVLAGAPIGLPFDPKTDPRPLYLALLQLNGAGAHASQGYRVFWQVDEDSGEAVMREWLAGR
jgi:hypothetical protein